MNFFLLVLSLLQLATAYGGQDRGGGDIEFVREPELRRYIETPNLLKKDLRAFFSSLNVDWISDPVLKTQLQKMINSAVDADIQLSVYSLKPICLDEQRVERSASTIKDQKGSEVCFNLKRLAERGAKKSELIGLAAHEHARHFGFEDTDPAGFHPVGAYVARLSAQTLDTNSEACSAGDATEVVANVDLNSALPLRLQIFPSRNVNVTRAQIVTYNFEGKKPTLLLRAGLGSNTSSIIEVPYTALSEAVGYVWYSFRYLETPFGSIRVRLFQGEFEVANWNFCSSIGSSHGSIRLF